MLMVLTEFGLPAVGFAALLSAVLTVLTFVGWSRTGNSKILFIAGAFLTHLVKSVVVLVAVGLSLLPHEIVWGIEALFDVLMLVLLFVPFMLRA